MTTAEELLEELRGFALASEGASQGELFAQDARDAAPARGVEDALRVGRARVPRITNEFWERRQRQGHSLHELSYRACFKAELPRFFIERLTRPGDVVLDPFMGRGTTLLEAALLGRCPWGNDVNPLSRVLIEPRLAPPSMPEIEARIAEYELGEDAAAGGERDERGEVDGLDAFYHPETLAALRALRRRFSAGPLDEVDAWLRMVATNRLTGHSTGFFSVRTMPPNQAVSASAQRKLNAKHERVPPPRDVRAILARKSRSLLRKHDAASAAALASVRGRARFLRGDARAMAEVPDASVDLVVTSPPFLDVIDYAADNWLRCWFNGFDASEIDAQITRPRRPEEWQLFVTDVMRELERVLAPGAWVVFEVGEVRGGRLLLEELVVPAALEAGLRAVGVAVHAQDFTKTANCWGVANNAKGTNTNRLVLLQKTG